MKECGICKKPKLPDRFHKKKASLDGLQYACKDCVKLYRQEYYQSNKSKERNSNNRWKELNPNFKEWHKTEAGIASRKKNRDKAKQKVIAWFGGKCADCGSQDGLELDHVNGDGKEHRKMLFGTRKGCDMYQYLASHNMDAGGYELQLLCYYCHKKKTQEEMKARRGRG